MPVHKNTGIAPKWLAALFVLKVAVGCFFGWISLYYYGTVNDTWIYFNEGSIETDLILHKPKEFFTNIFTNEYKDGIFSFFQSAQSFWHSFKTNLLIKFVAILNLFSFKNYWINVIFFNFIFFFGFSYFYRLLKTHLKVNAFVAIIITFLLPSFLLFSSGIHKEAIVFACLSYIIFFVSNLFAAIKQTKAQYFICLLFCFLLFIIRDYVMLALLPALLCWFLISRFKWNAYLTYLFGYVLLGTLFFSLGNLSPKLDFPNFIIKKQTEFRQLTSVAVIPTENLSNSVSSFGAATPRALYNAMLKPHLADSSDYRYILFALELIGYYSLVLLGLFFRQRNENTAILLFFIFFSLSMFWIIGLIVPNVGAIVRYRSIYLPFILTPIIAAYDWKRLLLSFKISRPIL
jgi:hypothetical protein